MSNINPKSRARFPFGYTFWIRLQSQIENVDRASKRVVVLELHVDCFDAGEFHVGSFTIEINRQVVHSLLRKFSGKWPQHDCGVRWAVSDSRQ